MKRLLVLAGVVGLFSSAHAAVSCADCGGRTCMLDGSGTVITGGATSLIVNFCNYDNSKAHTYALKFGVSPLLACDVNNGTLPELASLVAAEGCTAGACSVTVSFRSALDWAIALQNNGVSNALTAQLTNGGSSETVTVATFVPIAAAVMSVSTANISVCATEVKVGGLRLSSVASCNVAEVCRGATTDTVCSTELMNNAHVTNVSCSGEACTGKVVLSQPLPCDGSVGPTSSLIVGVTVASSTHSNYVSVGSMAAPNFSIADTSGLEPESSKFTLTTDTFCATSEIYLNATTQGSDVDSGVIEVSRINSSTNGTVVVELMSPLSIGLAGKSFQLSLSQCGVSTKRSFIIGFDSNSSSTSLERSQEDVAAKSRGSVSTQEAGADSGLSGGIIVAIIIPSVALAGFIFEYIYHTRRQPKPLAEESSNDSPRNV